MGAQLNIKSDDAYQLASRLSELTGDSLTTVVTKALRAELARETRERERDRLRARLDALTIQIAGNLTEPASSNHDWLYDDATGLPR